MLNRKKIVVQEVVKTSCVGFPLFLFPSVFFFFAGNVSRRVIELKVHAAPHIVGWLSNGK